MKNLSNFSQNSIEPYSSYTIFTPLRRVLKNAPRTCCSPSDVNKVELSAARADPRPDGKRGQICPKKHNRIRPKRMSHRAQSLATVRGAELLL